jgi:hypothetical protein
LRHFKNDEKVVESRMQIRFIACGFPPPFDYLQEGNIVDSLTKHFSQVADTLLKGLHAVSTTGLIIH